MNPHNPERKLNSEPNESEKLTFADKLQDLLPGVEFEEPTELIEARKAVLEALAIKDQNVDFIQFVWVEYSKVCEQIVDDRAAASPHVRTQLQIAALVHKALIFREIEDVQRYGEDLSEAKEYAFNAYLDEITQAINTELDSITTPDQF